MHPSMMRRAVRPLSHLLPKRLPQQQQQQASRALSVQAVVDDVAVEVTHTSSASAAPPQQPQQPPRSGAGGFQGETRVLGGAKAVLRNVRSRVLRWNCIGLDCLA